MNSLLLCLILIIFIPLQLIADEDVLSASHGKNSLQNSDTTNLTDNEKWNSENYIHQGLSQRTLLEECKKNAETEEACQGRAANKKFLGMSPSMVQAITRMYATVIGTAGGDMVSVGEYNKANPTDPEKIAGSKDSTKTAKVTKSTDPKDAKDKSDDSDKSSDYCKYVAVATEGVAAVQQTLGQSEISSVPTSEDTKQLDALNKAAREHGNRSTQAKTQTIGWGVTTGCYAVTMTAGNASGKAWQNWAKLSAAAVLTVFFKGQIDAHEDYKDKVLAIAKKMPGKGDCNPVTNKDCYCAQEETKHDPKVCLPYLHQEELAKNSLRIACVDSKLQADPKCNCLKDNNCYDKEFMNTINGLQFGRAALGAVSEPFSNITRGRLSGANLSTDSSKLFARAKSELKKLASKRINTGKRISLNANQKKEEDALVKLGLTRGLANKLAAKPVSGTMKRAMSNFNGKRNRRYRKNKKTKSKVLRFSGGDGLNKTRKSKSKNDFLSRFKNKLKRRPKRSKKVLMFANRAKNQAQINNNKGRIIFDIISHRYQTSGLRRLELID